MSQDTQDRALLRRFEPVIKYTRGERFFPMDVTGYVQNCSLWRQQPGRDAELLVPQGELTLEKLGDMRLDSAGSVQFLKFTEPLNLSALTAYRVQEGLTQRKTEDKFRAGRGRLARVGYGARVIDAFFQLTSLLRGRVPGDTATAALLSYQQMMRDQPHYCYYGRVVRQQGWVVCQYWFFYAYNNWRSAFFGGNDHESDWEMICVYLSQPARYRPEVQHNDDTLQPVWVAYAVHDYMGDDLRRRWDDPELEKIGEHPVVYAGAGSHASYFQPGEYLTPLELPFLLPLVTITERLQRAWDRLLRRYRFRPEDEKYRPGFNVFRIPFVDYARGDGVTIGPGQEHEWSTPRPLDPAPDWVRHYRGLWGLFTRDPVAVENAPAGPRYRRDGGVRRSWYDPLGWAGLEKVPPLHKALSQVHERREQLQIEQHTLATQIDTRHQELIGLGVDLEAMQNLPHLQALNKAETARLTRLRSEADQMRATMAENEALLEALDRYAERLENGDFGSPRAHISRPHEPAGGDDIRFSLIAEGWAAVSTGLFLLLFVLLFILARDFLPLGLAAIILLILIIEAAFRRRLGRFITIFTGLLAFVAALVLLYEFFWGIVLVVVVAAGSFLIWDNLRELWT
jgi:uncharacterized protein (UPF0335 family)